MQQAADWQVVVDTVRVTDSSLGKRYRALQVLYHPSFSKDNNDYDLGLVRTVTVIEMEGKRRLEEIALCSFKVSTKSSATLFWGYSTMDL